MYESRPCRSPWEVYCAPVKLLGSHAKQRDTGGTAILSHVIILCWGIPIMDDIICRGINEQISGQ